MRFLIDAQLPPALAHFLMMRGHDAAHVADLDMMSASDTEIWNYAVRHGWMTITKDADFAQRSALTAKAPAIVWVRVGNTRRAALLTQFENLLPDLIEALLRDERVVDIA